MDTEEELGRCGMINFISVEGRNMALSEGELGRRLGGGRRKKGGGRRKEGGRMD